jgi:hypothetical protein
MALKVGTENRRNVIIVVALLCVLVYLGVSQLMGPSTPAPVVKPAQPVAARQAGTVQTTARVSNSVSNSGPGGANGPEARVVTNAGLDPALHLEKLALSESIEYAGNGRNIFSENSAPAVIEAALANPRPGPAAPPVYTPPPVPQPPAIDLKYFGYSASKSGTREAFLVHGEDIFQAAAGEIVNHRYKVVSVDLHSVQITDLSYNNTQTLPLVN